MNASLKKPLLGSLFPLLVLGLPLLAAAATPAAENAAQAAVATPLVDKVHNATARYTDLGRALHDGFVPATPCVSGPDTGAMGVHFVKMTRITAGVLDAERPEALIYEPMASGAMRLVGVEFIVLKSVWEANNPGGGVPALDGNLLNFVNEPNRYGLPAFYELHVWAWEHNPKGSFADWNTLVTCDHQAAN
jgi:hypothetical protein